LLLLLHIQKYLETFPHFGFELIKKNFKPILFLETYEQIKDKIYIL